MRVRYREDVGWEMRCDDCKRNGRGCCYWPLLPLGEFWNPRTQKRCLTCERIRRNRRDREQRALHPRHKQDAAAAARARYWRNRDIILERCRARYAARKAA